MLVVCHILRIELYGYVLLSKLAFQSGSWVDSYMAAITDTILRLEAPAALYTASMPAKYHAHRSNTTGKHLSSAS